MLPARAIPTGNTIQITQVAAREAAAVTAQADDVFQQATQEGTIALRLDRGNSVQEGQRFYTNSSW